MSFRLKLVLSFALLAVAASPLPGQTLQRDPVSGDYILEFTDIDGVHHRLVVEPRNKISPRMAVAIESSGAAYVYRYALTNESGPNTKQPISVFLLPCPRDDQSLSVEPAPGWHGRVGGVSPFECEFNFGKAWLESGQSLGDFIVRSAWLPAPADAWVFGAAPPAGLPVSVGSVPDTVVYLLKSVQRIASNSIGGRHVHTLVPARSPAALDNPTSGLSLIRTDLDQVCGELGWITHTGICRSLEANLEAAARSLERGNTQSARGQLEAFLHELDAQHGPQPGKHVSDNAYWLLKLNAEHVLNRML